MTTDPRYEADVIVIGAGLAGISAANELLDRGRNVLLIERGEESRMGGLARDSFGGIFFVDTPIQRRSGIRDSKALALEDWLSFGELGDNPDTWPRRWAEAYVDRCRDEVYDWLTARSVSFFPVVHWVERGNSVPGNSVPRFHMVWGTGHGLMEALVRHLRSHRNASRLRILCRHRVDRLTVEHRGVVGCSGVDEESGGEFEARAGATIVASGGITGDLDRVRRHWYKPWGEPPAVLLNGSHTFADGRLHDEIQKIGGSVKNLDMMWNYAAGVHHPNPRHVLHGLSLVPPKSALWVNWRGARIGPPALVAGYDTRWLVEQICREERKYSYQIMNRRIAVKELAVSGSEFNEAIRDKKRIQFLKNVLLGNSSLVDRLTSTCADFVTAGSVGELAEKLNALNDDSALDAKLLEREIRRYDGFIERGPSFHNDSQLRRIAHLRQYRGDRVRTCRFQRILEKGAGPLIGVRLFILTRKSLGGVQTDLSCRVLAEDGSPIPGLYAVGETAGFGGGGVHGKRALEGTFLGSCILTGRVAAQSIERG